MRIARLGVFLFGVLMFMHSHGRVYAAGAPAPIDGVTYNASLIDQAVASSNGPGGLGLRAGRNDLALSLEPGKVERESRDWDGLKEDTLYFGFTQMAVIGLLYVSPKSISGWSSEKKDEYSFEKWRTNIRHVVWDTDQWWINFGLHPYWGGSYYVRAAERGYGPAPSFWYSFMLSTIYEFGAEALFEQPSIQDLVFTPGLGFFVGRYFMSVREGLKFRALNGEALSGTDRAMLFFTDPLGSVNSRINSALGRQASFTLVPVVMVADTAPRVQADDAFAGTQSGDVFSGMRLHLTW
ncbi:MAG: DUF3943 domain-containing protein [Gammaproteobacteria bacterium]